MTGHRSRTAWAGRHAPPGVHDHRVRMPKLRLIIVGLVVCLLALTAAVGALSYYVYQQQQYIEGRGEYRDREATRLEQESTERIRRALCDLMDQLPEGGLLERPRAKYGCGPGIPLSELPPEEAARIEGQRAQPDPRPGPAPSAVPPQDSRILPGSPTAAPTPEPSEPTPMPGPTPDPDPDPGGLTELLCDATGVCI